MDNYRAEIAGRLRSFMESKGWMVGEFADKLEISGPAVSQYLHGVRTPGHLMQDKLRKLGCNIEWLMTGKAAVVRESDIEYQAIKLKIVELKKENDDLRRRLEAAQSALDPQPPRSLATASRKKKHAR